MSQPFGGTINPSRHAQPHGPTRIEVRSVGNVRLVSLECGLGRQVRSSFEKKRKCFAALRSVAGWGKEE